MIIQDEQQLFNLIKAHEMVPDWITQARTQSNTLNALITGENFTKELINHIEQLESSDRRKAREKYSKDIRDVFNRIFTPRENVFSASGGSVHNTLSDARSEQLNTILDNFKGNKSITQYFADYFFTMLDKDPNGVLYIEYKEDKNIYPTYKSIHDIRGYQSNGQNLDYIIFEPVLKQLPEAKTIVKVWRVVDEVNDFYVTEINGNFSVNTEKTYQHPFGSVPGIVLSSLQKTGTECRYSPVTPIEALAKDYARDKSILTVYKFIAGFPVHWRYIQHCRACSGTGRTGKTTEDGKPIACKSCNGTGRIGRNDVTDIIEVPLPRDSEDAKVAPHLAGFVSPDLDTWKQLRSDQHEDEIKMEDTIWGTHKVREGGNETATGKFIDVQPVINKLNHYADNVEWCINQLIDWCILWMNGGAEVDGNYKITLGRSYIIESPDTILERYEDARVKGSNFTVLDKLLKEYIMSKYKNNPIVLAEEMKKAALEPYVHLSFKEVYEIYGNIEAQRKNAFGEFWQQCDKTKDYETLKVEFNSYFQPQENEQTENQ